MLQLARFRMKLASHNEIIQRAVLSKCVDRTATTLSGRYLPTWAKTLSNDFIIYFITIQGCSCWSYSLISLRSTSRLWFPQAHDLIEWKCFTHGFVVLKVAFTDTVRASRNQRQVYAFFATRPVVGMMRVNQRLIVNVMFSRTTTYSLNWFFIIWGFALCISKIKPYSTWKKSFVG